MDIDTPKRSRTRKAKGKGRPPGRRSVAQDELDCFCERVAMGWPVKDAAESIGRSRQSLYALRTRRKRFRQDWADAEQAVALREEQFFTSQQQRISQGVPRSCYARCCWEL